MAFVCPPRLELLQKRRILKGIKNVLLEIEDDMAAKIQMNSGKTCCNPHCPYNAPSCPRSCPAVESKKENVQKDKNPAPPDVMVCYKIENKNKKKKKRHKSVHRVKQSKSRELRAGILYRGCWCEKRNGLQDDCPRTECHGKPECLTMPSPTCGPSEFCDGKHLYKKLKKNQKARKGVTGDDDSEGEDEYEFQCFPGIIESGASKQQEFCDLNNCPAYA